MSEREAPRWLQWAREIQALAQTGEAFTDNHWQSRRYQRLMEIAAEIISDHTDIEAEALTDSFRMQAGYATPKVDVRGAVFRDGKLLLVRELSDGCWCMPGGWADVGNKPAAAVEREVWEESGFRVRASKVIGVYDANRIEPMGLYHAVKLVFLCELLSGEAMPSDETTEVKFFTPGEIPEVLSGYRTNRGHIRDAYAAWEDSSRPTVFD